MATEVLRLGVDSRDGVQGARTFERALQGVQREATGADRATGRVESSFGKLRGAALALNGVLVGLAFGAVSQQLQRAWKASDDFEAAVRRLNATAKLTGQNLGFLQKTTLDAREAFGLSTATAAEFTAEILKLTSKAGQVEKTGAAIGAFLDLGAARGLTASETLQAVSQAILGIDEGTDKLFGKNPSVLYDEFAKSVGKTAGQLTDAGKAAAILEAAMRDGGLVAGEYADWLESDAGQAYMLSVRTEEAYARIGLLSSGIRRAAIPALEGLLKGILWVATEVAILGVKMAVASGHVRLWAAQLDESTGGAIQGLADRLTRFGAWLEQQPAWLKVWFGVGNLAAPAGNFLADATAGGVEGAMQNLERLRAAADEEIAAIREELRLTLDVMGDTDPLSDLVDWFKDSEKAAKDLARALKELQGLGLNGIEERRVLSAFPNFNRPRRFGSFGTDTAGVRLGQQDAWRFRVLEAGGGREQDTARALAEGARGLVDLADAAGLLGDSSRRALSGLSGLISSISNLKGASGIGLAGGLLGLFGAGAQIISGLLGGDRGPSERERMLEENNKALDRLRLSLEGFRATFDKQLGALQGARQFAGSDFLRGKLLWGNAEQDRDLVARVLAPLGLTFEEFSAIAEQYGVKLELASGNLDPDAFAVFAEALRMARLNVEEFGKTLEGQRSLTNAFNEIFDVTDPAALLSSQVGLLAKQAPNLFGGLAGLDFSSAGDRALLEAALRDLVTRAMGGGLTAEDLGGFTSVEEFLQSITGVDRALDGFTDAANEAASAMLNVPKALPLELIRQSVYAGIAGRGAGGFGFGSPTDPGGNLPPSYGPVASQGVVVHGGMTVEIVNEAGDSGEDLVRKWEQGVQQRASRGQYTYAPNLRTSR